MLLDALVRPTKKVTDYRTQVTGLDEATLNRLGQSAEEVKEKAASILLNQKVVVGHAIHHDLDVSSWLASWHPSGHALDP